jgi:uncharacterized protein YbjT (DUF2867 family)
MILVTGATGKVGRPLVAELEASGTPFRVGARSPGKAGRSAVFFDYDRPESFGPALDGVTRFFLLTSGGTEREAAAVEAARKAGVSHVVKLSVWGAEEDSFVFGRMHRAIEKKIEESGIPWTLLRPNGFMQNFTTYKLDAIRARGAIVDSTGDGRWSIVDTRDVGAVAARVLTHEGHEGRAYALSGPESLSQAEMAERVSKGIGKPVRYVDQSDAEYRKSQRAWGAPEAYAEALVDLNAYYRRGGGASVTRDVEKVLGRPPGSFDQFVRDHAALWK